jgi:hypothetical protein
LILVCGEGLIDLFVGPAEADLPAIRDLLGYAMAAAAVTVSRNGADLPTEADVEAGLAAPIRIMSGDGMPCCSTWQGDISRTQSSKGHSTSFFKI